MQPLLSESLNKRTKLTTWQQATIEITPMITLLRVHTTYIWVFLRPHPICGEPSTTVICPHPICGEPSIQRHAKKWQQKHSLQNFCTNWIFAEGSTKADDVSFAAMIIYIRLV